MGCSLKDFTIGAWHNVVVDEHEVAIAPATTKGMSLPGVVYKLDGRFQGFTGDEAAVVYHVKNTLKERAEEVARRTELARRKKSMELDAEGFPYIGDNRVTPCCADTVTTMDGFGMTYCKSCYHVVDARIGMSVMFDVNTVKFVNRKRVVTKLAGPLSKEAAIAFINKLYDRKL